MTTITWVNKTTGESRIQIFKSKDKLEKTLQLLKRQGREKYIEEKQGKKKVVLILKAVSYETSSERALFRNYDIIPKKKDYPDEKSPEGEEDD